MTYDQARTALLANGQVTLEGRAPASLRIMSVLTWVLIVMTTGLTVGMIIMIIVVMANGTFVSPIGFGAPVMAAGLVALTLLLRRRHLRLVNRFRMPVAIGTRGILLRGIGPIPWHDFLPPTHRLVAARYDDGMTRRAIMPLTQSGFNNVNVLPASERTIIGAAKSRLFRGGPVDHIEMPGVEGLSSEETMQLIAEAHQHFSRRAPHAA